MTEIVVITLAGLNIFQIIFWSRQTQKLLDRAMSRSFQEYQVAQTITQPKKPEPITQQTERIEPGLLGL